MAGDQLGDGIAEPADRAVIGEHDRVVDRFGESRGARLCKESEWQFACEGEAMLPYPYGLSRDASACNIAAFDARPMIDAMRKMSFSSRDTARAADILNMALEDKACSPWLILAGSTSAGSDGDSATACLLDLALLVAAS